MAKHKNRLHPLICILIVIAIGFIGLSQFNKSSSDKATSNLSAAEYSNAKEALDSLEIKEPTSKTDYDRDKFSSGWSAVDGCDTRNSILQRDLSNTVIDDDSCTVLSGTLTDPYSGEKIDYKKGDNSIDIDHIVPLSDAWQKGAQNLSDNERKNFYHDPSNLLAVDAGLNRQKGDDDAASWLPPNKGYYCQYIEKQIEVKAKYSLWVTQAEHDVMDKILSTCKS